MSVNSEIGTYIIPQTTNTKWETLSEEAEDYEDTADGMEFEEMQPVDRSEVDKDVSIETLKKIDLLQHRGSVLSRISQKIRNKES